MNAIDNYQAGELTRLDWHNAAVNQESFGHRFATFLGGPSPLYNCHGLTFAAKRTQVNGESRKIHWLLNEDGYRPLADGTEPRVGDVAIYYDDGGEVEHSGIVVGANRGLNLADVPLVWSKWGKGHEVVHALHDCPYSPHVRFFRMKPWQTPVQL